jgi:hypothetical protein
MTGSASGDPTNSSFEGVGLDMASVDLSTAENTYATLLDAREKPRKVAADLIRVLRTKTQNSGKQVHEVEMAQADAWLAICALSKSLDSDFEVEPEAWSRAISRTEEWRNLLDSMAKIQNEIQNTLSSAN